VLAALKAHPHLIAPAQTASSRRLL
jgi:hypothetical protein